MKEEITSQNKEQNKEELLINSTEKKENNIEKENIPQNIFSKEKERKSIIICLSISLTIIIICSILGARSVHKNNILREKIAKEKEEENSANSNKILLKYYNLQLKEYKLFDTTQNNISSSIHSIIIDNQKIKSKDIQKYNFTKIGQHIVELKLNKNISSLYMLFKNCDSLISVDFTNFNSDNIENMGELFYGCISLTNINFTNFNTANVTKMNSMFYNCESVTSLDLNNFETYKVVDMSSIFYGCNNLIYLDIEKFYYNNSRDYNDMFYNIANEGKVIYKSNHFFLPMKEFENWEKKDMAYID